MMWFSIIYCIGCVVAIALLMDIYAKVPDELKCDASEACIVYAGGGALSWFTVLLIVIKRLL